MNLNHSLNLLKKMDKKERKRIAWKIYYNNNKDKIKERRAKQRKEYRDNNKVILSNKSQEWNLNNPDKKTINSWKFQGIIWNDYDIIYDLYINATICDYCSKEFKNSLDKCCDHNHAITDANNIRGFLCRECNFKDVLKGCDIMELGTD